MKRLHSLSLMFLIAFTFSVAADLQKYGEEITLTEKTDISDILSNPENFEGERVLVEGTVINVCENAGCWIEVAGSEGTETIKVKVDDGVIVFPMEAKGKKALVEGEVYSLSSNPEMSDCDKAHGTKDMADSPDCKDKASAKGCCSKDKSKVTKVYQIKGLGAVIG